MTDEQKVMYTGICMCRNAEMNLFWQRNQLFTIINLAAIPILFTRPISGVHITIVIIGFFLCLFWSDINYRSKEMIIYWHSRLALMEPSEDSPIIVYRVFTGMDWEETDEPMFFPIVVLRMSLPGLFISGWILVVISFLFL